MLKFIMIIMTIMVGIMMMIIIMIIKIIILISTIPLVFFAFLVIIMGHVEPENMSASKYFAIGFEIVQVCNG